METVQELTVQKLSSKLIAQFKILFGAEEIICEEKEEELVEILNDDNLVRVLVLRSNNKSGRKILFDSFHVTDEGIYLQQQEKQDKKFLKEILAEFVFGAICLKNSTTTRFTKFENEKLYCWSKVYRKHYNHDMETNCSLPNFNNTKINTLRPTSSLPMTTTQKQLNNSLLSVVFLVKMVPLFLLSSETLFESQLENLKLLVNKFYTKQNFGQILKSYSNALNVDIKTYFQLTNRSYHSSTNIFILLWDLKILADFICMFICNNNCKVVIVTCSKKILLADAFIQLCQLINNFCNSKKTDYSNNNYCCNYSSDNYDSGIGFNSSCSMEDNLRSHSNSSSCSDVSCYSDKKIISNSGIGGFYLGDVDDEQVESNFELGEVDSSKLFPNKNNEKQNSMTTTTSIIRQIPLDFLYEEAKEINSVNNNYKMNELSSRFSPFPRYQLINLKNKSQLISYDYIHTIFDNIIEINLDKLIIKGINLTKQPTLLLRQQINQLICKTKELTNIINDYDKIEGFFLVHLKEIMKN